MCNMYYRWKLNVQSQEQFKVVIAYKERTYHQICQHLNGRQCRTGILGILSNRIMVCQMCLRHTPYAAILRYLCHLLTQRCCQAGEFRAQLYLLPLCSIRVFPIILLCHLKHHPIPHLRCFILSIHHLRQHQLHHH